MNHPVMLVEVCVVVGVAVGLAAVILSAIFAPDTTVPF